MLRAIPAAGLAAVALMVAGCGAKEQSTVTGGAEVVPSSAPLFVSVDTDLQSDQWQKVDDLLDSFPGKRKLLDLLRSSLREDSHLDYDRDVKPALGDEIDVVWLDLENSGMNVVGMTKPDDEQAFKRMLSKWAEGDQIFFGKVDGWLVFSDSKAKVDRFREQAASDEKLSDHEAYRSALAALPDNSLVHAYASGKDLTELFKEFATGTPGFSDRAAEGKLEYLAAAIAAEDKGLRFVFAAGGEQALAKTPEAFESKLVREVPGDALAFVSFQGSDFSKGVRQEQRRSTPTQRQAMRQLERVLGFRVDTLLSLLEHEVAFYVRPHSPIPELTLLLEEPNEGKALARLNDVMAALAQKARRKVGRSEQGGVPLRTIDFGELAVHYGGFDSRLIVTTGGNAIDPLGSSGDKLADDEDYRNALDIAGAPRENGALIYVNIRRTVGFVRLLAATSDAGIDDEVWANLRPLRSFVLWGEVTDKRSTVTAFLQID